MKKKGFTLVELLAVIAILAILVIIALPNIMALFNEAKKNSFANEVKELYKTAQNQWMSDSMNSTTQMTYGRFTSSSTCTNKELQLSGRTQLEYGITIDKAGKVIKYFATDGSYFFEFNPGSGAALAIEDIDGNTYKVTAVAPTYSNAKVECDTANSTYKLTKE